MSRPHMPLHAQLRDALQRQILEGQLQPGDRLPSEAVLADTHGVSRITVRNALGALQGAGLIVRQQGRGAFVAPPVGAQQRLDHLQGLGAALEARGQQVHNKRLRMRTCKAPSHVGRALGLPADAPVIHMTVLRYVDRVALSVNQSYYPLVLGERLARLDLSSRDLIEVLERDLGLPVVRAELDISACAMPIPAARWLGVAHGSPALKVQRVLVGAADQPIQVETIVFRSDAFSYRLSLRR